MKSFTFTKPGETLSVLCLGAHSDDIEIGVGGTILNWIATDVKLHVHWCVLSAIDDRAVEAKASAATFLTGAASANVEICGFKDGFFPYQGADIKNWMEALKYRVRPDIIFTHRHDDAHQDHREISQLTWNSFRDHVILEYEIPKWDGDLRQPNLYSALPAAILDRKLEIIMKQFQTQCPKDWFDPELFRGLARLRGMECRAPDAYAEGLFLKKAILR